MKDTIYDGYKNIYTRLGTSADKSRYTNFCGFDIVTDQMLFDMWVGGGIARQISTTPADDMTRAGWTISGDVDLRMAEKLDILEDTSKINLAISFQRHFGGSVILMGVNDGGELIDPVNINNISSIDYLRVYDRTSINPNYNYIQNEDNNFGEPELFTILSESGLEFTVHSSRLLVFRGIPVPRLYADNNFWFWGMGAIQECYEQLRNFGASEQNASIILHEFVIGKYKIMNLAKMIHEGRDEQVQKIYDTINLGKSVINSVLLDKEDDYVRDSVNLTGLPEMIDRFMMFLSGVTNIPVTRLFGRSAAGMNSTGQGDLNNYYDFIMAKQRTVIKPQLKKLVNYINISKEFGSYRIDSPKINFTPLFQETQEQIIKNRELQAKIDDMYIRNGVLTADEVRQNRFVNGYSYDLLLEDENNDLSSLEVTVEGDE